MTKFTAHMNTSKASSAAIVIWVEAPYQVLATDKNGILGYLQHEIVGETVEKLTGTLTDVPLFKQAIHNTSMLKSSKIQLILYDKNGRGLQLIVSFEPLLSSGIFIGCLAVFRASEALTFEAVSKIIQDNSCAQCLVSSEPPHVIQMINDGFVCKFGCKRDNAVGKPLPSVASPRNVSTQHHLSLLLFSAGEGGMRRYSTAALDASSAKHISPVSAEEAIFVPVVEAPNGRIRQVLVLFPHSILPALAIALALSPSPCLALHQAQDDRAVVLGPGMPWAACTDVAAETPPTPPRAPSHLEPACVGCTGSGGGERFGLCGGDGGVLAAARSPPPAQGVPAPAARASCAPTDVVWPASGAAIRFNLSREQRPPQTPAGPPSSAVTVRCASAIRPRRPKVVRAGCAAEAVPAETVVVTRALLDALRGRPLPAAARAAGVSATSFKRACRQLGVRRWNFRRGKARGTRDAPAPPPAPA